MVRSHQKCCEIFAQRDPMQSQRTDAHGCDRRKVPLSFWPLPNFTSTFGENFVTWANQPLRCSACHHFPTVVESQQDGGHTHRCSLRALRALLIQPLMSTGMRTVIEQKIEFLVPQPHCIFILWKRSQRAENHQWRGSKIIMMLLDCCAPYPCGGWRGIGGREILAPSPLQHSYDL